MKQHFFITAIFILTALTSSGQQNNSTTKIVYEVDFEYLEGCETGKGDCKPVTITRHSTKDSIRIVFPKGGTQSDVYIYSSDCNSAFIKYLNETPQADPRPILHDQKLAGQGRPTLNLTGFSDGKYALSMFSCGLGGSFELTILTR